MSALSHFFTDLFIHQILGPCCSTHTHTHTRCTSSLSSFWFPRISCRTDVFVGDASAVVIFPGSGPFLLIPSLCVRCGNVELLLRSRNGNPPQRKTLYAESSPDSIRPSCGREMFHSFHCVGRLNDFLNSRQFEDVEGGLLHTPPEWTTRVHSLAIQRRSGVALTQLWKRRLASFLAFLLLLRQNGHERVESH